MSDPKDIRDSFLGLSRPDYTTMFNYPVIPVPPPNPLLLAVESNYASEFHKRLAKWIGEFDASLDQAHEVGVRLISFGQSFTFHLVDIGYWDPSLVVFRGITEDGNPVELIQHVTQISVLLMKMPRADPSTPKRPIGFDIEPEEETGGE
jgi:hypothetical protein